MILYGSLTSPYVRRIRLFMEGMDYEFRTINIFDPEFRASFRAVSPIKRLPVLQDGEDVIFDSHIIYQYLRQKQGLPVAPLRECNQVSVIDAVVDSCITLLLGQRSGLSVDEDHLLFRLQRERLPDSLAWLAGEAETGGFDDWHYGTMCLVAMLDWLAFREFSGPEQYPVLQRVSAAHAARAIVRETLPVA